MVLVQEDEEGEEDIGGVDNNFTSMPVEKILKTGERVARKVSSIIFLFAITKAIVGFISGSVALLSDALHSITDAIESLFVWFGFKISQRKPTEKFPYGFYKAENLTAFFISFLIIWAGFEIFKESFERIFIFQPLKMASIAVIVAVLDALSLFLLGRYEIKIGKKINSQSLTTQGKEIRLHIISSSIVVIGILSSYFGISRVEGIVGILLSLLVLKVGIESLKDSIFALMDVSPSKEIEERIKKTLRSFPNIEGFSNLKLRKSGPFIFGEVNIKIKKFVVVERAHEIVNEIEQKIKNVIPQLDSFSIHIEPFKKLEQKIIIPAKEKNELDSLIDNRFGRAEFFAILTVKKDRIESFEFKENPFKKKEIRAGLAVTRYLLKEKPDVLIVKEIGPISFHTLRDNLIEVYKAKDGKIREIVDNFLKGKLIRLKQPTRKKE